MLPAAHRMRRGGDFTATTRGGRRTKVGSVVVHQLLATVPGHVLDGGPEGVPDRDTVGGVEVAATVATTAPALVGFVVGKTVGNSVVRHRVTRRLRAQALGLLPTLPPGSRTVVRALPGAATATSVALSNDLAAARRRLDRAGR